MAGLILSLGGCGGGGEGPDAMAAMVKNKMVRIGTDPVNLPFEFGEGVGVRGFDVDIGNEIAKDLGYEPKWVKIRFEQLFEVLKNGEVEMVISAMSITPERRREFAFSDPYFDSGNTMAIKKDREGIKALSDLSGKRVGVQSSSTGQKFMETQKVAAGVNIVKYATLDDALGALNRMEADAVVGDEPILAYSIWRSSESFGNLITLGNILTEEKYAVLVRKNDKELLAKINATLGRLKKSGQLDELKTRWFDDMRKQVEIDRRKRAEQEALKDAPKDITFTFNKTGGAFNMDRLDGYEVVLQGAQSYKSTPILTSGNRGNCRIAAVPPGEYRLNMAIFKLNTTLKIPRTPTRSLNFDMNISGTGLTITQK